MSAASISPRRRQEIIDALRRGTVPRARLDSFAVGLERLEDALHAELETVKSGGSVFKAIRGEYGSGKTFFTRWLAERAKKMGFAVSEVQISETETPLHRLETIYRRLMERLSTADTQEGAFRNIVDGWFYCLEEDVLAEGGLDPSNTAELLKRTEELLERRLASVTHAAPMFSSALRAYRRALAEGDTATAEALIAWVAGQPNVGAAAKRTAGIVGAIDHYGAMSFLQGLLTILRDSGQAGLLIVLDEVETIQRVRRDVRDKSLNAIRQLVDEIDSGRFPGLYLLITGTPAFFDGPQGISRLEPLAQRLHVDFQTDARFDNPRAVQIRLSGFDLEKLCQVGAKIRDIYQTHAQAAGRIAAMVDNAYIEDLAKAVTGKLGGKVGIAPRLFLKKLVGDVLDRVDQYPDFDPREHYKLTLSDQEQTRVERAAGASSPDAIELDL
ncbi:BREX system ATP-binding protein BrxD [Acidimicrobium ferrooxidans]|nr:BREX system ATP-binding protein BrxD [Acidimicrobium ferrooxidans]